MTKYVYEFADGNKDMKDLLGGKGANLAEMANMGLPVPPGFTITLRRLPCATWPPATYPTECGPRSPITFAGWRCGPGGRSATSVIRCCCRYGPGAKFSMPGMMETVLDIGLNDATVAGLAARSGDERFAWDSYRRLIQMFGKTVRGIDDAAFAGVLDDLKNRRSVAADIDLSAADLRELVEAYKKVFRDHVGDDFPQAPHDQLNQAVAAVFASWNAPRAALYRRQERIPNDLGTAVNVMMMVYGNLGSDSGTGVAFTRDPATGARGIYGDYLSNAQGEDVVAGIRNAVPLEDLATLNPSCFTQLTRHMSTLETHYRDLCDIEFTIERGKLWMLQTRVGKRTAAAAFIIATQLVDEDLIDLDEALSRVNGAQLAQLMFPSFVDATDIPVLATGVAASPGAAVGRVTFDSARAAERAANGESVILVRRETNPDDLPGIVAAQGVLTSHGGKTSHAAVVARGMGRTCVCGADSLDVDTDGGVFRVGDQTVADGDVISIDGTTGKIYLGAVPVQDSPVVAYFETGAVERSARRGRSAASEPRRRQAPPRRARQRRHRRRRRFGHAASVPPESGCAAPSTCSSATGGSWWRRSSWPRTRRHASRPWMRCCRCNAPTSRASSPPRTGSR